MADEGFDRKAVAAALVQMMGGADAHDPAVCADPACRCCELQRLADAGEWDAFGRLLADATRAGEVATVWMSLPPPVGPPPGRQYLVRGGLDAIASDAVTVPASDVVVVRELAQLAGTAAVPGPIASGLAACRAVATGTSVLPMATASGELVTHPPRGRGLLRWTGGA